MRVKCPHCGRPMELERQIIDVCCPHCRELMGARTSRPLSATVFEVRLWCKNKECGFGSKLFSEFVAELAPPRFRNPAIVLPVVKRRKIADDISDELNDVERVNIMPPAMVRRGMDKQQ